MRRTILFLVLISVLNITQASIDNRYHLGFNDEEKAEFLSEMRQMLASIQQITLGIGIGNKAMIIKAAHYSGNRMARATPQSIKDKTPVSFEKIGGPTHMMFEELAINAVDVDESDADDMKDLTELTGKLMRNCLVCHEAFTVD